MGNIAQKRCVGRVIRITSHKSATSKERGANGQRSMARTGGRVVETRGPKSGRSDLDLGSESCGGSRVEAGSGGTMRRPNRERGEPHIREGPPFTPSVGIRTGPEAASGEATRTARWAITQASVARTIASSCGGQLFANAWRFGGLCGASHACWPRRRFFLHGRRMRCLFGA